MAENLMGIPIHRLAIRLNQCLHRLERFKELGAPESNIECERELIGATELAARRRVREMAMHVESLASIVRNQEGASDLSAAYPQHDPINHPSHYTSLGARCAGCGADIECIQVTEHLDFVIGNIVKYAWRAGLKKGAPKIEDLQKCLWYAQRAVDRERKFHAAD